MCEQFKFQFIKPCGLFKSEVYSYVESITWCMVGIVIFLCIALDLMKLPATRRNALCMTLCWFAFSMGYFGLVYNTPAFDWNIYLVFVFPTFFMIPVSLSQPFMENKLGRKPVMTSTMVLAGLCLLLTSGVPNGIIVIILGTNYSKQNHIYHFLWPKLQV